MVQKFYLKTEPTAAWSEVKSFFVKVSSSTWTAVTDAWVKVSPTSWAKFWTSATNPDTPIEILTSYDTNGALRLQGKNYHWSPSPQTLTYKFTHVDGLGTTSTLTTATTTTNPASGSSTTVPSSTTYRTVSRDTANSEFTVGGVSTYKFSVTGTMSNGSSSTSTAEYQMRTPKAPTLSVEKLSGTSVKITISAYSNDDYVATNRYIVSTYDQIGGTIESGGGRGGYGATTDPVYVTLTGLTAGRLYYIYVTPFTGDTGSTEANAKGYKGETANITTQSEADYTFAFGNTLYVGTNGYISLDSGNSADAISSTSGRVIGILPGDLQQDTANSIWYWSDSNQFIIRWEGYDYGQTANLRQYEIVFNKNNNYASVYGINVANTTEGTEAYVKNGVAQTSYTTPMGTGSWRYVYFDGITNPTSQFGPYAPKSKSVMKQVTGLTSGSQDVGYTAITTSINQNQTPTLGAFNVSSFTKGGVSSSSQGAARSTTLSWSSSSGATAYQIQYQGSNDNVNWTTVQAYSSSSNVYTTSDSKTWSTTGGNFGYYTFMRANIRSLEDTGLATYVYSDNGSYVEASGTAPGQPTFGTVTYSGDTASVPFTVGSQGTNYLYSSIEYQYRISYGSYSGSWSTSTITNGAGTISLSGLSSGSTYYIKIRTRNYDDLYSPENETNFSMPTYLTAPTITSVTPGTSGGPVTAYFTGGSGPYYQIYWTTGVAPTFNATPDAEGSSSPLTDNTGPTSTGTTYYMYVRSVASLGYLVPGPSSLASAWSAGYAFTVTVPAPTNATAPTLSPTSVAVGTTLTAGRGTWNNSPTSYDVRIYRGTQFVSTGETLVASGTGTSVTYTVTQADYDSGQRYFKVYVNATNAGGSSGFVGGDERGPIATPLSVPSTPTGLSATTNRSTDVFISWNASASATTYEIWWGGPPADSYTPDFYPGSATYYFDTGISQGSSRTYYVRARNAAGASPWSGGATGTRTNPVVVVNPPTGLSINLSYSSGPSWSGSWSASGATSYSWSFYTASDSSGTGMTFRSSGSGTSMSYSGGSQIWGKLYVTATNSGGSISGESAWT